MTTSLHEPQVPPTAAAAPVDVHWGTDSLGYSVGDVWHQRSLLPRIGIRVMIKGLAGTVLGPFWIVAAPIVSLVGFGFLFGSIAKPPSHGVPYLVFMLAGALGWSAFERVAFWGTRPRRLPPHHPQRQRALAHGPDRGVGDRGRRGRDDAAHPVRHAARLLGDHGHLYLRISPQLLLAPVGLVLSVLVGWSVAFWTGTLNARARDVRLVFRWVLLIWLYVTPVLYPLSSLPEPIAALAEFNPVVAPVEMVKEGFLNIGSLELSRLAVTLGFILVVGGSGAWFCTHMSPRFIRSRMGLDDDEEDF